MGEKLLKDLPNSPLKNKSQYSWPPRSSELSSCMENFLSGRSIHVPICSFADDSLLISSFSSVRPVSVQKSNKRQLLQIQAINRDLEIISDWSRTKLVLLGLFLPGRRVVLTIRYSLSVFVTLRGCLNDCGICGAFD